MDAKVEELNGVYLVSLSGQMDFESADSLKMRCSKLFASKKVIFNLSDLNFVGSSGITPFLELLRSLLQENGNQLKICSVGTEFMRLFEAGQLMGLEVYENSQQARLAYDYQEPVAQPVSEQTQDSAIELLPDMGLDVQIKEP